MIPSALDAFGVGELIPRGIAVELAVVELSHISSWSHDADMALPSGKVKFGLQEINRDAVPRMEYLSDVADGVALGLNIKFYFFDIQLLWYFPNHNS